MFTLDYFLLSALLAVFAFVYTNVLTQGGNILQEWDALIYNLCKNEERLLNGKPYHWFYKAFVYCEKCVAGQLALWVYLILAVDGYRHLYFILVLKHILFITLTIFFTLTIKIIYQKSL